MSVAAYRLVVIGSILSSFLAGFHIPAMHDMIEHGARVRLDVLTVTVIFVLGTIAGGALLLRSPRR